MLQLCRAPRLSTVAVVSEEAVRSSWGRKDRSRVAKNGSQLVQISSIKIHRHTMARMFCAEGVAAAAYLKAGRRKCNCL